MPPGGLPDVVPRGAAREPLCARSSVRFARGRGPFTTAEATARFGSRRRAGAARARARRAARPRRAAPRRHRARVVRPRRAAAAAPRVARRAAPRGRAGRAGGARRASCRPGTAIDRRASLREALVPLQGAAAAGRALGDARCCPRRVPGLPARAARRSSARSGELVWVGAGLDRVAVYFREDAPVLGRPPVPRRRPKERRTTRLRAALGRSAAVLARPPRRDRARRRGGARPRSGISSGRAR